MLDFEIFNGLISFWLLSCILHFGRFLNFFIENILIFTFRQFLGFCALCCFQVAKLSLLGSSWWWLFLLIAGLCHRASMPELWVGSLCWALLLLIWELQVSIQRAAFGVLQQYFGADMLQIYAVVVLVLMSGARLRRIYSICGRYALFQNWDGT